VTAAARGAPAGRRGPAGASATGPAAGAAAPVDAEVARLVNEIVVAAGLREHLDLVREMLHTVVRLGRDRPERLDLKIAAAALGEMTDAFEMFAPYRGVPKLTMFGSARTAPDDALYRQARAIAERLAAAGWMVVTGAGPGIMAAGAEGAGPEMSLGVNIRLPLEQEPNSFLAPDGHLVEMKYFFTRKLMLMKESKGFVALPGGFGTLDETFELLTLVQTGKAEPAPIVLVDLPGDGYWRRFEEFLADQVVGRGFASPEDRALYRITDDVGEAVEEVLGFYRNYHSRRFVGDTMVLRLRVAPSDAELAALNEQFADLCSAKGIWRTDPLPAERATRDHLGLARIALEFDRHHHGRLRQLIDALNRCEGEEPPARPPADRTGGDPPRRGGAAAQGG
jgi:uncharacterized protein (TIGR00730 family)